MCLYGYVTGRGYGGWHIVLRYRPAITYSVEGVSTVSLASYGGWHRGLIYNMVIIYSVVGVVTVSLASYGGWHRGLRYRPAITHNEVADTGRNPRADIALMRDMSVDGVCSG